jgi:biopolymer transport protein ExbD
MKLRKEKRVVGEAEELDITSLMDVLVIILVFLLQNFDSSEFSIGIVEELILPYSTSKEIPRKAPVLQANAQEDIYLNGELICNLKDADIVEKLSHALKIFSPKDSTKATLNLLFDKKLTYKSINHILRIVDGIGFNKYKLIVQGDA